MEEQFLPLSTIFYYLMLDFYVKTGIGFSRRDKRLFKMTEVEITRIDCNNNKDSDNNNDNTTPNYNKRNLMDTNFEIIKMQRCSMCVCLCVCVLLQIYI